MKRTEKVSLLAKVLQGTAPRQHLQRFVEASPGSLVIIDDFDEPSQAMTDNSPVFFHDRGQQHRMTLGEAHQYARRYFISTLIVIPNNHR